MFYENELILSHHDDYACPTRTIFALSSVMENEPQLFSDHVLYDDLLKSPMITCNHACHIHSTQTGPRKFEISKETLSNRWDIGLIAAQQTLRITTQKGIRQAIHPLHRRYRTNKHS
jgi:hypothetical protein